jgi:4a-hydroxytetrahydrobiopterin dehydratase
MNSADPSRSRRLEPAELDERLARWPGVEATSPNCLVLALGARSVEGAAELVSLVVRHACAADRSPEVDLRGRTVVCTVRTPEVNGVTETDLDLAELILRAAREAGAELLPAPDRLEIAVDTVDPERIRAFWQAALGYQVRGRTFGDFEELRDPDERMPSLWFQPMDPPRTDRNRIHLDVYVPASAARARVETCLAAGGRLVTDAHAPAWWVLADAEGNEVCLCTTAADPLPEG